MEKDKIIELLNLDLQDEHGAIIQYLTHAYAMGEGEMACEIEAMAREEMRHLDWLAETMVELGGQPSLKRGTMNMAGKTVPDWMGDDVKLEEGAIENYKKHIEMIDEPKIKRLLKRILADEQAHHGKFEHLVEKAQKEGLKDIRGDRKDSIAKTLNWGIEHEYTVVLQYLFHSYMTGNDQSTGTADMLKADIKIEKQVAEAYDKAAREVDDAGLKELLIRIRDNEKYHIEVFNDLLEDEEDKKSPGTGLNIGDSGE